MLKACGSDASTKHVLADVVTVDCPDHLVLVVLPIDKGLGSANVYVVTKIVGGRASLASGFIFTSIVTSPSHLWVSSMYHSQYPSVLCVFEFFILKDSF